MHPYSDRPDRSRRPLWMTAALLAAILAAGSFVPEARSGDHDDDEIPFDEAFLFFELNNTDGDLGIHAKIDGDGWKKLSIEDTNERKILDISVRGRLAKQGLTELFFESAEPTFDELDPADFFARFPEGVYEAEGLTLDGEELESEMELTHVMPAPVGNITVNGVPDTDISQERCDDEDPAHDPILVMASADGSVTIEWDEVTLSHPDADGAGAAVQPPVPVTIVEYTVVVEADIELSTGEDFETNYAVELSPEETSAQIPAAFIDLGPDQFKYEILAREESYNQTAVESCFIVQ